MISPDAILLEALPGREVPSADIQPAWRHLPEQPCKFWEANDRQWAAYVVVGMRVSRGIVESIKTARRHGLESVLLVPSNEELQAVAEHFADLRPYVACEIAGRWRLMAPPRVPIRSDSEPATVLPTRVPVELLSELMASRIMPRCLRKALRSLEGGYRALLAQREPTDAEEQALLARYARSVLGSMGFRTLRHDDPLEMVRRLEVAGWGGRRDHFFHSFQNYLFGLFAVVELPELFNIYRTVARLHWELDPLHVWFLTALWHDVGYGIARFNDVFDDIFGPGSDGDPGAQPRADFLRRPIVKMALDEIGSLMARLLNPSRAHTEWLPPPQSRRRSTAERRIHECLRSDVMAQNHAVASALRLYSEYVPIVNRMGPENRDRLKQTVLLACASTPFHDWRFREQMREVCGGCQIGTNTMPFASLLAFVDSIQDDRRDLPALREQMRFLEKLTLIGSETVTARVNPGAIEPNSFLWKLVAAREVSACLRQSQGHLSFMYPEWMVS